MKNTEEDFSGDRLQAAVAQITTRIPAEICRIIKQLV